jgi:hypothetical protein
MKSCAARALSRDWRGGAPRFLSSPFRARNSFRRKKRFIDPEEVLKTSKLQAPFQGAWPGWAVPRVETLIIIHNAVQA